MDSCSKSWSLHILLSWVSWRIMRFCTKEIHARSLIPLQSLPWKCSHKETGTQAPSAYSLKLYCVWSQSVQEKEITALCCKNIKCEVRPYRYNSGRQHLNLGGVVLDSLLDSFHRAVKVGEWQPLALILVAVTGMENWIWREYSLIIWEESIVTEVVILCEVSSFQLCHEEWMLFIKSG